MKPQEYILWDILSEFIKKRTKKGPERPHFQTSIYLSAMWGPPLLVSVLQG